MLAGSNRLARSHGPAARRARAASSRAACRNRLPLPDRPAPIRRGAEGFDQERSRLWPAVEAHRLPEEAGRYADARPIVAHDSLLLRGCPRMIGAQHRRSAWQTEAQHGSAIGSRRCRKRSPRWTGSTAAFATALGIIVVWAVVGPLFRFSDTWQLVINTGTTIVTFLMVFLIQRTQNKDALAMHLKLNELVAAMQGASNRLIDVEELSERRADGAAAALRRAGQAVEGRDRSRAVALGRGSAPSPCEEAADRSSARPAADGRRVD